MQSDLLKWNFKSMVTWKAGRTGTDLKKVTKQVHSDRYGQCYEYNDGFTFTHTLRFMKYYTKHMYFTHYSFLKWFQIKKCKSSTVLEK